MAFTISINDQAAFEVLFAGPAGPTGPQGVPGEGVAAGGTTGQVLKKLSATDYDTGWSSDISGVAWGGITGTLSTQTDLQSVLNSKLDTTSAAATYYLQSNPDGFITALDLTGYATENFVLSQGYATEIFVLGQGYITSSALIGYATESFVNSGFYPLTGNPSSFITSAALAPYLLSSTAASTYQPLSGMSAYLTKEGNLTGITNPATARSNLDLGSVSGVTFASATIQGSGSNVAHLNSTSLSLNHTGYGQFTIQPSSGITFPDATTQTTAYTGGSGTWGSIVGTLSNQADLQSALDVKLDQPTADGLYYPLAGNPSAFIDASALIGYATESFVTSQGYITDAPSDGYTYGRLNGGWSAVGGGGVWGSITGTLGDQTDLATVLNTKTEVGTVLGLISNLYSDIAFGPSGGPNIPMGRLLITDAPDDGAGNTNARVNFSASATLGNILQDGDFARDFPSGHFVYRNAGTTYTIASTFYVNQQGFITSASLAPYAPLAGATFTGKVNMAAPTAGSASLNLGVGTAPTTSVAGDIWIATNINFRDVSGTLKTVANTTTSNTFSQPQIIQSPLATTTAALRVTQLGTGNAIQVEDSTTPDATAFVVDQHGKVGVGTAPDATAAIKIDGNGMSFNGLVFNPTATDAHTGGPVTLDLLVTINGTNYRLGLRPA